MIMNRRPFTGNSGFTLFEVLIALAVFMIAVIGIATALNTAIQSALEVRHRSILRAELESQLAIRMGDPLDRERLVLEAKENHGIRVEERLQPFNGKDRNGRDIQHIAKLTITASIGNQSDTASILVNH